MSMTGEQRLELERARLESLRLDQVRRECSALIDGCESMLREVRDVAVQQLVSAALRESARSLRTLRGQIAETPDATRTELLRVTAQMHDSVTHAEAKAKAWTEQQAAVVAKARDARHLAAATGEAAKEALALGQQAEAMATRGDLEAASQLIDESHRAIQAAAAATLDESVRREVVRGLLRTLKDMGFVTADPQIAAGTVVLEGRLASGRRARFEVSLDGKMEFDLDGYEGRSCAEDLRKVETTLRDRFGVLLGPPQVVWKNPDRIGKSSRELPPGEQRQK